MYNVTAATIVVEEQ